MPACKFEAAFFQECGFLLSISENRRFSGLKPHFRRQNHHFFKGLKRAFSEPAWLKIFFAQMQKGT